MNFGVWIEKHRRSIVFLLAAFAVAGVISSFSLPVSLFPRVNFPRVVINLDAGDRTAERMVVEVTLPVEEAVRSVPGVRNVRSNTSRGGADISINFAWGTDMVSAMLQVESALNAALVNLPAGTTFEVRRMDPTVFPVLGYSLVSDSKSLTELRDIAMYQIRPVLTAVEGVAKVEILGGGIEEYQIMVDPAKLDSFGLSLEDVAKAVSTANVVTAVGRLEENNKLYLAVSDTQFKQFEAIAKTVLRSGTNGLVLLEDVATVSRGVEPQWHRVTADGHDAVIFQIIQQPDGNTVQIAREVAERLAELKKILPAGVRVANWYDQSELITASAHSVRDVVIVGIFLAALILLIFLRDLKVTLIAIITVPMVLAATILLLALLHMSFNIMTLGGMAAAVGLIIDDSIVMIEHITRRARTAQGSRSERILKAAEEFTRPLAGSSMSTIIIFAPLAFLSGVTGSFFKALSLTISASLIISYFVAWMVAPIAALALLNDENTKPKEPLGVTKRIQAVYSRILSRVLPKPWLVLVGIIPLLALGFLAYSRVGSGFMPPMDEGGFVLDYRAASGASLTETDRLLRQVEDLIRKVPEVETYSRRTGLQLGGGITEANEGDFFVRLKNDRKRGIEEVMDDVRGRVEHRVPGLEIEILQLMEDLIGDLTAVPQPIEIKLFSDNGPLLEQTAPKVAAAIEKIDGVVDVKDGIVLAGDALEIRVDREKAALEGMEPEAITGVLEGYLTGIVTTQVQRGPKMVSLRVWIPPARRKSTADLERLRLRAPDGHLFPVKRVASVTPIIGQPQISRDDLKRMVPVTGRISGRDMGSTIREVKAALNREGFLPKEIYYSLGGLYEQQRIAFRGLIAVFGAAVVLVFVLLLYLYESFRVALAMMLTTLLAAAAVFIGLWVTGTELNITAMMGMTMVVGIVTEVGIFYYSEYADLAGQAEADERLFLAGKNRMRPIAMTTFATILALLPLALGIGQGSAMQQPLAIAIISGLVVQMPLVLIVLPALLKMMGHEKKRS